MNDPMTLDWVAMAALVIAAALIIGRKLLRGKYSHRTKKDIAKLLQRQGALRQWKVYNDVDLGEGAKVDHLVVGPFGILIACDLHQKGSFYGELEKDEWILAVGENESAVKSRIPSPLKAARQAEAQVRKLLGKNKIYNIGIDLFVPRTQGQPAFITGGSGLLVTPKELKTILERAKYDKDNGVDLEAVSKALGITQ